MTQAPAIDRDAGAFVAPETSHGRRARHRDHEPRSSAGRRLRSAASWALVLAAAVLLWPAQWGGLVGLTIVNGQSMEPNYTTGDLVVTWRQSSYEVGDVISYTVPDGQDGAGGHVIHRVLTVDGTDELTYTTMGDNNPTADQWLLTAADVTGVEVLHLPGVGLVLSPAVLPYILAAAIGGIVTVLLWSRSDADEPDGDENPAGGAA